MPLMRFDAVEGRTPQEIQTLLDAAHRAMVTAFGVPDSDRYQIYQEHPGAQMIVHDTGLGIPRTDKRLMVSVTSMPRSDEKKQKLYAELCRKLGEHCGIAASDIMVSICTNGAPDWSFGNGVAQFLTGDLKLPGK